MRYSEEARNAFGIGRKIRARAPIPELSRRRYLRRARRIVRSAEAPQGYGESAYPRKLTYLKSLATPGHDTGRLSVSPAAHLQARQSRAAGPQGWTYLRRYTRLEGSPTSGGGSKKSLTAYLPRKSADLRQQGAQGPMASRRYIYLGGRPKPGRSATKAKHNSGGIPTWKVFIFPGRRQ